MAEQKRVQALPKDQLAVYPFSVLTVRFLFQYFNNNNYYYIIIIIIIEISNPLAETTSKGCRLPAS